MRNSEVTEQAAALARVERDVDLRALNTFGLPARAARFALIENADDVRALLAQPEFATAPRLVLGGGSNIVLTRDFDGLVLKVAMRGRRVVREDGEAWYVEAGAGENWHDFVRWTLAHGMPGLENLSLIPGTVGAAPVQNIGAYGVEAAQRLDSLRATSLDDGGALVLTASDCAFGYRDSVFKQGLAGRVMITAVTFRLPKRWTPVVDYADVADELARRHIGSPTPTDVSDAVGAIRRRKLPDPAEFGNAGSFFKNPVVDADVLARLAAAYPTMPRYPQPGGRSKLAAGWLIDRCGWKGRNLGPVGAYERQALVLVNRGGASGDDVRRLARAIQHDVAARFGVQLEPEPTFV